MPPGKFCNRQGTEVIGPDAGETPAMPPERRTHGIEQQYLLSRSHRSPSASGRRFEEQARGEASSVVDRK